MAHPRRQPSSWEPQISLAASALCFQIRPVLQGSVTCSCQQSGPQPGVQKLVRVRLIQVLHTAENYLQQKWMFHCCMCPEDFPRKIWSFRPEDGGSMFLWNVCDCLHVHTAFVTRTWPAILSVCFCSCQLLNVVSVMFYTLRNCFEL
jgi:hypothetical protein